MLVNCISDSIQRCSWQPGTEFDAPSVRFEHSTVFDKKKIFSIVPSWGCDFFFLIVHTSSTNYGAFFVPLQYLSMLQTRSLNIVNNEKQMALHEYMPVSISHMILTISMKRSSLAEAIYSPVWLKLIVLTGHLKKGTDW